jgi:8-oxo-dGTP pyrophosphatase MutT (NUDIX family)
MITEEPKENPIERIMVVSAAIVDVEAKRLFVQRRDGNTSYSWHWCMPGGKALPSESLDLALARELYEEHGVRSKWHPRLWLGAEIYQHEIKSTRTGETVVVRCFRIDATELVGPYIAGPSVAGFDWVTANELETLTLTPADDANRGKLMALLR